MSRGWSELQQRAEEPRMSRESKGAEQRGGRAVSYASGWRLPLRRHKGGASAVLTRVGRAASEIGGECNGPPHGGSSGANIPVRHNSQGWASRLSRIPRVDTLLLGRCEYIWDTQVPVLTFEYLIDFQNTPPAGKADSLI